MALWIDRFGEERVQGIDHAYAGRPEQYPSDPHVVLYRTVQGEADEGNRPAPLPGTPTSNATSTGAGGGGTRAGLLPAVGQGPSPIGDGGDHGHGPRRKIASISPTFHPPPIHPRRGRPTTSRPPGSNGSHGFRETAAIDPPRQVDRGRRITAGGGGCPSRFWSFPTRQTRLVPTVLRGNALPDAPASAADRYGHGPRRRGASKTAFPRRTVGTRLDIDQLTPKSRGAPDGGEGWPGS